MDRHDDWHLVLMCMPVYAIGAAWPLNVDESQVVKVSYLLTRAIRRNVLFHDECMVVHAALEEVSG